MDKPYYYEICVEGELTERWSDWFDGLTICIRANAETMLTGSLHDQTALHGVLEKIRNLNLILISVRRASERGLTDRGMEQAEETPTRA
jgi:hypothetical protein